MSIYKRSYKSRKYNGSFTGGSGDVNPQFMHLTASQSGNDATTTTAFPIPIQRLQNSGRAQVMEILKVYWYLLSGVETDMSLIAYLTTSSSGTSATNYGNTRVIDGVDNRKFITTSGTFMESMPINHDLTDGAGHGMLVATDSVFIQVASAGTSATNVVYCKILYRWKDVSTTEYVGIVQSQQ